MNFLSTLVAALLFFSSSAGWACGGFPADWKPPVVELTMANAGQTITFDQRDMLRITLEHPSNAVGYWQIDRGLSDLDIKYGDVSDIRGSQVNASGRWSTIILVNTVHMPANELKLTFHTPSLSFAGFFTNAVYYRLKGYPAAMC